MFCGNPTWQLNSRAEGLANFPIKGKRVDILGFVDWMASGNSSPLPLWGKNSHAVNVPKTDVFGCVPIIFYLQSRSWAMICWPWLRPYREEYRL